MKVDKHEALVGQMAELQGEPSRRAFLQRHQEVCQPETVRKLADEVSRLVRVDAHKASSYAEIAILISEKLTDGELTALSRRAKGNALYALGDNQAALKEYEQAIGLFRQTGAATEVARTASSSIQPLILLGHYDQAFAAAEQARRIFEQQGDRHRLARLENNVGNILHRQDRFDVISDN